MPELRRMYPDIPAPIELPPEQQRRFLFNAYREFIERAARVTPFVAVFEDLHWADDSTLLLLEYLAHTVSSLPALLIGTYRDVELDVARPFARTLESLLRQRLASRRRLRRLSAPGVESMLKALSSQNPPPKLTKAIFDETEGNPFFVEEVFRHLAEEGRLLDDNGAWRPQLQVEDLRVPEGVRLVIGRRLERLNETSRRVLATAAVIGRSFSLRLLEQLETTTPDAALDGLEEAERAHLVEVEQAGGDTRYRFVHELIRQTLREGMALPRRQRLHARIAYAIERVFGPDLENHSSALAHHLYQAGSSAEPGKALKYLMAAASLASGRAAHEEALGHVDNALSLLEGVRDRRTADLYSRRALALRSLSRLPEAFDSYERAIALFEKLGEVQAASEAGLDLGGIHGWDGDGRRTLAAVERALHTLGSVKPALRLRLLVYRALTLVTFFDTEAGLSALADAKSSAGPEVDAEAGGMTKLHEALLYLNAARLGLAGESARLAIDRFRARGDLWGEAEAWELIPVVLYTGSTMEVARLIRETEVIANRVGHPGTLWLCKNFSAEMHLALGDLEQAERLARESYDFGRYVTTGWVFLDTVVLGNLALYRGRFDEAAQWFRRGLDLEFSAYAGMSAGGLFSTLAVQGDPGVKKALVESYALLPIPGGTLTLGSCACLAFIVEGLAWLERHDEIGALQPHAEHVVANGPLCVWGQHLFQTTGGIAAAGARNWSRAEEHHQEAIRQADTAPYRVAQPIARYWYADMLLSRNGSGDSSTAVTLLREALPMLNSMGIPDYSRRVTQKLAGSA